MRTFKSPVSYFYGGFRQMESMSKMQLFSSCYFFEQFWRSGNIFSPLPISYLYSCMNRISLQYSMTIKGDSHQCGSVEFKSTMLTYSNFWPQATSRDLMYCTENVFKRSPPPPQMKIVLNTMSAQQLYQTFGLLIKRTRIISFKALIPISKYR